MNKKLMLGLAAGVAVGACVAASGRCKQGPSPDMWAKMRQKMEEMPKDFPPRVMFDDVEQTKANTEEILTLLRRTAAESAARADAETVVSG